MGFRNFGEPFGRGGFGRGFGQGGGGGNISPPVNSVLPVISGTPQMGQTLSVTNGTWSNSPTSYTYQWKRAGVDIGGATANTYASVSADMGTVITCTVTATNAGGSASATSAGTAAIAVDAPTSITSLKRWLDANDISTLWQDSSFTVPVTANNDPVGGWQDKSGNAKHATQSTATRFPLYQTNRIGGKATVKGDGSNDYMTGVADAFAQPAHVFLAIKSSWVSGRVIMDLGTNDHVQINYAAPSPTLNLYSGNTNVQNNSLATGTNGVLSILGNGASSEIRVNGGAAVVGNAGTLAPTGLTLFDKTGLTAASSTDIGELCVYSKVLSTAERVALENYLGLKWGITF